MKKVITVFVIIGLVMLSYFLYMRFSFEPNWYNIIELEQFNDDDIPNPLNSDNIIYTPKAEFIYSYKYHNNKGEQKYCHITFDKKCMTDKKISCNDWVLKNKRSKHSIDSIRLYVYATKGRSSLANSQTIIKFEYLNNPNGKILTGAQTGVIEDSTQIFLHPPRNHAFAITEFNPFPIVKFPLTIGNVWQSSISIPPVHFDLAHIDGPANGTSFDMNYEVINHINLDTPLGDLPCYVVEANSQGEMGTSRLTSYFNEQYGFLKLDYVNIDGSTLVIDLESVKQRS